MSRQPYRFKGRLASISRRSWPSPRAVAPSLRYAVVKVLQIQRKKGGEFEDVEERKYFFELFSVLYKKCFAAVYFFVEIAQWLKTYGQFLCCILENLRSADVLCRKKEVRFDRFIAAASIDPRSETKNRVFDQVPAKTAVSHIGVL